MAISEDVITLSIRFTFKRNMIRTHFVSSTLLLDRKNGWNVVVLHPKDAPRGGQSLHAEQTRNLFIQYPGSLAAPKLNRKKVEMMSLPLSMS